jgi:inorganic pyrophosphatase
MTSTFWDRLDELIKSSEIVLDRPNRITVPPIDYGYLSGTSGGDGDEIDVWKGSLQQTEVDAIVCTVDLGKRDAEVKVLIGCSDDEKKAICEFHTSDRTAALLVQRSAPSK